MAFLKKISFLGFLVGSVVDIVASNIWGVFATFYVIATHSLLSTSATTMTSQVLQIFKNDPLIITANLIVGGLCSILGGYIGALIARHDELLNGALSSFFCVMLGIYSIVNGSSSSPLALALLSLLIGPALCMFGGYLRLLQKTRKIRASATDVGA
jgi:hypothetical protein